MGEREQTSSLIEPRDEFQKARFGVVKGERLENTGFELFQLAQKMEVKSYSKDISKAPEQEKRDILLVTLAEYIADIELGPDTTNGKKHPSYDALAKKRDSIYDAYGDVCMRFVAIIGEQFRHFQGVDGFHIEKGVMTVFFTVPPKTDKQNLTINLTEVFRKGNNAKIELNDPYLKKELQGKVRQDISVLRESLETESFFGGAIIMTYEQIDTMKRIIPTGLAVASGVDITYRVKKFMYRDETGKMQDMDSKVVRKMLQGIGDKTRINSMIFRIMREAGRVYNPIRGAFTDMTTVGIDRATERVKSLKRTDIEKGKGMSDVEFEAEKQKVIQEIARMPRSEVMARVGTVLKSLPSATLQGVIYGVFFADYQKHSYDSAQLYRGFAEAGLFEVGQRVGQRVTPGLWKIPGGIMAGGLAVMGGQIAGGAIHLNKKIWRAFPDRMTTEGAKSFVGHAVTGGVVNDTADRLDRDVGIPGTRGGAVLYNPFGKDGIMPNVDFAGTHITFGTDPRQYLQSRVGGTDIHWNKRMDEYVSWATAMTMKVLQEYENNRGYFAVRNGKKEELLRERLKHVFDSEDGANTRTRQIVEDCIGYVTSKLAKIKDLNSRKELLSIFLGNYGNILKLDTDSLAYDGRLLERDKTIIDRQRDRYLALLSPEKRGFAEKVFTRLSKGERLIDGKIVTHGGDMIGQEAQVFMRDKAETGLYQSLIDDTIPVKEEWYDILGYNNTIDYQNLVFQLPDKRVNIGGKTVYLRSYFGIMFGEYLQGIKSGNMSIFSQLDKKYDIQTAEKVKNNGNMVSDIKFQAILLESLCISYPDIHKTILPPPTLGDTFTHLLNTYTEYREQSRFIETQKKIGYANKWKLF